MNSKNFNAAQKHFEKKRVQMQKSIGEYARWIDQLASEKMKLRIKVTELESENAQLKEWIERLLTYTELSLDDIKKACEKDKNTAEVMGAMVKIGTAFGGRYL